MVPEAGESWGIFGGVFDPVHRGHLTLAEDILTERKLNGILFVPSFQPPHKADNVRTSFADRSGMLRLALEPNSRFALDEIEAELDAPGFSLNVVAAIRKKYPGVCFYFIVGADHLQSFKQWHKPEQLAQEIRFLVGARPGFSTANLTDIPVDVEVVNTRIVDISASQIRELVATGTSEKELATLVPKSVVTYILKRGLYR
jgi:nicotinate-nucleotide adenylyltransferase